MAIVNWHIREQLAATNALIHFLETHGGHGISRQLLDCRTALESGDVESALRYAYGVKPFGMGSINDGQPECRCEFETPEYCRVVQEALTRNWMFWMSAADHERFPVAKALFRAVGSLFK